MSKKTRKFKAELTQLMDIIVHSLYSHQDVFLRELLSNSADAIDKVRFDSLQNQELLEGDDKWGVRIVPNEKDNTLTISDNGIGMSAESISDELGTIARSGTKEFLEKLKEAKDENRPDLIGQFGVGFYSAFMVADKITVLSRRGGEKMGVKWESTGEDSYSIDEVAKDKRGTDIILHLKEDAKDWGKGWKLRQTVKKFSNFIEHPIVLVEDDDGKEKEETLNSSQAIWLRSAGEVKEDEYNEFYKHISHDFQDPAKTVHYAAEGTLEFKAILFIPSRKPFDMFQQDRKSGLHLYVRRIFIMDNCEKLLPQYLSFINGVVESSDLPLNVSRELLQEDKVLSKIGKNLTKKVISTLAAMKKDEYDDYVSFWKNFGVAIKSGVAHDWEHKDDLAKLLLFESTTAEAGTYRNLDQVVEGMDEEHDTIYYMIGESREIVVNSPYMESFADREVLVMTDPVDEMLVQGLHEYKGKKLKAIDRGESEDVPERKEFESLLKFLGDNIEEVKEVRLSNRLKESPACLVGAEGGMGVQMEQILKDMGSDAPKQERSLEINPEHPVIEKMRLLHEQNEKDERLSSYAQILYDSSLLSLGGKLENPSRLVKQIGELMLRDVGGEQ